MTDWELVRVDPREHRGEVIALDARIGRYLVGRSQRCDLVLHSAQASREHAEIVLREDGEWLVRPRPGKRVLADGAEIEGECELCQGLALHFGQDRLRARRARGAELDAGPLASPSDARSSRSRLLLIVAGGLAAALALLLGARFLLAQ